MTDEEIKKALECCSTKLLSKCLGCKITKNGCAEFLASQAIALIYRQKERIEELEIITGLANNRKYYRKFVDEVFCKQKGNELSEPDFDYIYQLYFEQQAEIDDLKRDAVPKLQDSLNRANKSGIKLERENARLKAEIKKMQKYNAYVAFEQYNKGRTEAIKEFAERLKSKYTNVVSCNAGYVYGTIKEVEKEMVGGENA